MKKYLGSVYLIRCLENGKMYVGFTSYPVQKRWMAHISAAKASHNKKKPLYSDINKYSPLAFDVIILEDVYLSIGINEGDIEKYWMLKLNTIHPCGYNIQCVSDSFMRYINKRHRKERLAK